jgi:hypothetical protein
LFPIIDDEVVDHHPGPFSGVRLSYNVLRNSKRNIERFAACVDALLGKLPVVASFRGTEVDGSSLITNAAMEIVKFWETQGVITGSASALEIDY